MTDALDRLTAALADRYRVERELGAGGMACRLVAQATARELWQGGMACRQVAQATARRMSLKRRRSGALGHVSDFSRERVGGNPMPGALDRLTAAFTAKLKGDPVAVVAQHCRRSRPAKDCSSDHI